MVVLFWFSIFVILYAYFGYPLCLYIISFTKPRRKIETITSRNPKVSLLISAYNEENVIEDKILNSLSLNYPKDLLEIVVVSDASVDRTDEIVRFYIQKGVLLRSYEGRIGKTACLNKAVPLSKGDIIVFSDANSKYDRDAIKHLVKRFNDPKVGLGTGSTKYNSKNPNSVSGSVGAYSKIEEITKKLESKIGSCVGADGAIFAIRKQLYQPLKEYDINDFVIPLHIIRQGYRAVLVEHAFCTEETAKGISGDIEIPTEELFAVVSDFGVDTDKPVFKPDQIDQIADLIQGSVIKQESSIDLYIDGDSIPLNDFVQKIFTNAILGMIGSLEGIKEDPERITISLFKKGEN